MQSFVTSDESCVLDKRVNNLYGEHEHKESYKSTRNILLWLFAHYFSNERWYIYTSVSVASWEKSPTSTSSQIY